LETIKRLIAMIENKRVYNDEIFTANLVIRDSV